MSTSVATTGVLINEFEQNPLGEDAGNEWVELFNPTNQAVNVSGWVLIPTRNRIHNATLQAGSIIAPLGYLIVQAPFQWLDNEWEIIVLKDAAGNTIDTTRNATDTYNDDRSWQRFPNGQDTNNDADWAFQPATKGVSNGGESIVTTTTTQQQTTTTTEQLTTTTSTTTWSCVSSATCSGGNGAVTYCVCMGDGATIHCMGVIPPECRTATTVSYTCTTTWTHTGAPLPVSNGVCQEIVQTPPNPISDLWNRFWNWLRCPFGYCLW
jgi:hypothetical protein